MIDSSLASINQKSSQLSNTNILNKMQSTSYSPPKHRPKSVLKFKKRILITNTAAQITSLFQEISNKDIVSNVHLVSGNLKFSVKKNNIAR